MKKLLVSCLCLAFILSSLSFSAFAQSDHKVKVKTSDGREVNITIKPGLESKVSQDMLTDLANENPNTDNITILDVGIASEPVSEFSGSQKPPHNELLNNSLMVTVPYPIPFTLTKTQTAADVFESDRFMDSCAKGETKTVSSTITASLSPQYTGIVVGLTLNGTISYSITKGSTLVGPPESSEYNSREFRCKFYENTGNWTQLWMWTNNLPTLFAGTYSEPSKYVSYSIDTYAIY